MTACRSLRIQMPDRPGALSAVGACLAANRVDIIRVDVVSHENGTVVDDLAVSAADHLAIARAIESFMPEVVVRTLGGEVTDPVLEMGYGLSRAAVAPTMRATAREIALAARALMRADFGALLLAGPSGSLEVLASTGTVPEMEAGASFAGRWAMRRGTAIAFPATAAWAPADFSAAIGAAWVAVAACGDNMLLLVARRQTIAFFVGELERLDAYSRAAAGLLRLRSDTSAMNATTIVELDGWLPSGAVVLPPQVAA